ncbi:BON domain-containing protein [Ilyomonas limi]|nr:BON domain-containing protein [Ilyomonas limi]
MNRTKPMYSLLSAFLLAICIAFTLPACTAKTDDASIQQRVNEELKKDRAGAALNATVDNGVVTITGECSGDNCAQDVADKVRKMQGVKDVQVQVIAKP